MLFEMHYWSYLPLTTDINCVCVHVCACIHLISVTTELTTKRPNVLMKRVNTDGMTFLLSFTNDYSSSDNYH